MKNYFHICKGILINYPLTNGLQIKKILLPAFLLRVMKRDKKQNSKQKKLNQLSFDFNAGVAIEIHTPKFEITNLKKELSWGRRPSIELVKN